MQSIEELGEVLCVFLQWSYGAPRKVWELEQRLVLGKTTASAPGEMLKGRPLYEGQSPLGSSDSSAGGHGESQR